MEVINKLRKKDTISLLKTSYVKSFIKENSYLLSRYKINLPIKKDDDYFYFESLVLTLKNKEVFEGAFVKVYDDMIDYWQTLNYEERKRLVNIDINQAIQHLPYVTKDGKKIYLPCFNEKINTIYREEMVLFELKQYNRLRFECSHVIDKTKIDLNMVKAHFTSLEYICGKEMNYWAYCPINYLLVKFVNNSIEDYLPILRFNGDHQQLCELIKLYDENNEEMVLKFLVEYHLTSDKMEHKIVKEIERRYK